MPNLPLAMHNVVLIAVYAKRQDSVLAGFNFTPSVGSYTFISVLSSDIVKAHSNSESGFEWIL